MQKLEVKSYENKQKIMESAESDTPPMITYIPLSVDLLSKLADLCQKYVIDEQKALRPITDKRARIKAIES